MKTRFESNQSTKKSQIIDLTLSENYDVLDKLNDDKSLSFDDFIQSNPVLNLIVQTGQFYCICDSNKLF